MALKEVSCRFFDILLRDLKERGIDPQRLVAGTAYTPAQIAKKDERVEWTALLRMMENGRTLWTREQLLRLGERSTEGPFVQFIGVVARIRFSVRGFYEWVTAPDGVASQMITCVKTSSTVEGPGRMIVDFRMEPGCEPSEEFFWITQGTYAQMPQMMGAERATVDSVPTPHGARFHIRFTEPRGAIASMRKLVTAPFTMRQAAKELTDAHGSLLARYEELDTARGKIERQAGLLDVAYQLGQRISAVHEVGEIGRSVLAMLCERRGVARARITLRAYQHLVLEQGTHAGPPTMTEKLEGVPGIEIELWTAQRDDDCRQLLALVMPTIRLALDNATAYHELEEYKAGLEKLVDERTSELRSAHDDLAGMVTELREAQAAREKFFGNISHEIRTPLSLILLAAGDIERRSGAVLDQRSRVELDSVTYSARKLVRLVDELLLLAAGQEDKLVLAPEPTDLGAMVTQIVHAWRPAAEHAGLELRGTAPARFIANVDPVAVERIVSNLVSNAVKYTPHGGQVELQLVTSAESIQLSVLDTGAGIDEDLAKRLFGRFERSAGEDRRKTGTGIGLALVKHLVAGHGGTVEALRRPTGGTELRVVMPGSLAVDNIGAISSTTLRTNHAPTSVATITSGTVMKPAGLSAGTILIAEDNPLLAQSVATLLAEQYTVVVALDGMAALELVKQHQPQLLITDVEMPGMSGIELAGHFRETTGDSVAPIIILSAVHDLRTRVAGLEAGAVDYVTKPFDPTELKARVAAQFRNRDLAMRLHRAEQLSSMGILTSGLAHELRNPANGIVNALAPLTELLPPELVGPETDAGQLLEAMRSSADQLAFLVRQLLGFKPNSRAELELRPTEVPPMVERAIRLARDAVAGVSVTTAFAIDRRAMCAAPLIVQVLANLVENAGHAAGPGGWATVRGAMVDGRISIEVSDSGPGVPIELRERIFEPFFTTKSPGKGTGLGLSVARAIIHRHKGTLEVRERGDRTVFVLDLPAETGLAGRATAV